MIFLKINGMELFLKNHCAIIAKAIKMLPKKKRVIV